jgi:hypothetical protein
VSLCRTGLKIFSPEKKRKDEKKEKEGKRRENMGWDEDLWGHARGSASLLHNNFVRRAENRCVEADAGTITNGFGAVFE